MKLRRTIAASLLLAALAASGAATARDGVYQSSPQGRNGRIDLEVTIAGGRISDIKILNSSETHPIADVPKAAIPAQIIKYQSTKIDAVTGASLTSYAIARGVQDCLKQAGLDPAQFSTPVPKPPMQAGMVRESADVVIVGAGGAGLSAAVAAAGNGKNVIVIEKSHYAGGNTSVAGGCYNAADPVLAKLIDFSPNRRAIVEAILAEEPKNELHGRLIETVKKQLADFDAAGNRHLFDSPELHALQTWKAGDYQGDLELVSVLAENAPKMQKILAGMGFKWQDFTQQVVGALWPRSNRASNYKSGVGYIDTFLGEIEAKKLPVRIVYNTAASEFIMKDGRVAGVKAKGANGLDYEFSASAGVILATGGFAGNIELRQKYDTIWDKKLDAKVMTTNVPNVQGDGIAMAEKAGAQFVDMGYIQLLPTTDPQTGATNHAVSLTTGIYVNREGKRYVNEMGRRDELARAGLAQTGHVFFTLATGEANMIDSNNRNQYGIDVEELIRAGKVFRGETWDELAEKAGINAENLKKTVEQWNAFCRKPENDILGRPACDPDVRLDGKGPYYATIMTPSVHHTMGGVRINRDAQVLDRAGKPIPGLWAAGEVTGKIHGTNRVGCNAVPDALVFGRIAGLNVSK